MSSTDSCVSVNLQLHCWSKIGWMGNATSIRQADERPSVQALQSTAYSRQYGAQLHLATIVDAEGNCAQER